MLVLASALAASAAEPAATFPTALTLWASALVSVLEQALASALAWVPETEPEQASV
ncbi:hypothetical protein [Cohnella phaseoli]|uniref:hypothetical protein n=1 Tax=Cohnella phaseoli TaxID=456490 RepID=UPI0015F25131|nr:hypothetical protein [Cohnella phaseoli]